MVGRGTVGDGDGMEEVTVWGGGGTVGVDVTVVGEAEEEERTALFCVFAGLS